MGVAGSGRLGSGTLGSGTLGSGSLGVGLTSGVGDSNGVAAGQGSAAGPEPCGVGIANEGMIPEASGVGTGKQVGEGPGLSQPAPFRTGPQDRP